MSELDAFEKHVLEKQKGVITAGQVIHLFKWVEARLTQSQKEVEEIAAAVASYEASLRDELDATVVNEAPLPQDNETGDTMEPEDLPF